MAAERTNLRFTLVRYPLRGLKLASFEKQLAERKEMRTEPSNSDATIAQMRPDWSLRSTHHSYFFLFGGDAKFFAYLFISVLKRWSRR
jgi:hypothetical protein